MAITTFVRMVPVAAQPECTTSIRYFKEADIGWPEWVDESHFFFGLEVAATEEAELAVRKLERGSLDAPILAELGDKAETSVSQFLAFLAANRGSTEWFIFYLRGKDGNLWAVRACWIVDFVGWFVHAHSIESPDGWFAGGLVVSRN